MTKNLSEYEESDFFSDSKKLSRVERKRMQSQDRSKYKKTDQGKQKKEAAHTHILRRGLVLSILGQNIIVESDGERFTCLLRGVLKKEKIRVKNLVIVGDYVHFSEEDKAISFVEERKTVLSRAEHLAQKKEHFIAANVDLVLICTSCVDPVLRPSIIDRYIIAASKGGLKPIIICNKIDLLEDPHYSEKERTAQKELVEACKQVYTSIGVPFLLVSTVTGEGIDLLLEQMKGHISVFSGQSGTGKTSLINAICSLDLKVGKTVQSSRKGSHTTSYAELLKLPFGGFVVDTPGIKSFGVWNITEEDLRTAFPEIAEVAKKCAFQDCLHQGDEGCAILQGIEEGHILPMRYESYLNLLEGLKVKHRRR